MPGLFGLELMPRKRALLNLRAVHSVKTVLGARMAASLTRRMPAASMVSRVTAVTLTGTFWRSAGSFCAVTVTVGILKRRVSSSVGVATAPAGTGVWPRDGAGSATAARAAARWVMGRKALKNMCAFKHTSLVVPMLRYERS